MYYILPTRYVYASTSYPPLLTSGSLCLKCVQGCQAQEPNWNVDVYTMYSFYLFVSLMAISGPPFVGHVVAPTIPRALLASLLLLMMMMMLGHLHGGEYGMRLGWALALGYKYSY